MAYLFERFPSFTQTFCYREVREMERQGIVPAILSIRVPRDEPPQDFPEDYRQRIQYLPEPDDLVAEMKRRHSAKKLPRAMRHALMEWEGAQDKHRVYEAAWAGPVLRRAGVRHAHVHFAGLAARTAYWMKRYYGIGYSFTGHANDIFCDTDLPVSLEDLVDEASMVVTVSDFSARELRERFPSAEDKIFRVYNGIDTALWMPPVPRQAAPDGTVRVVSVGRYIEKKGFADLVEACRILKTRGRRLSCDIVGEGPLEEDLRNRISVLQLSDNVRLTGPKSQSEILAMLCGADLFVLPCVNEAGGGKDNLPTVIMEAMACGLPVISTPVAGVPELVLNGGTGLLVPERSPSALADAMEKVCADPARAARFGAEGRKRAVEEFAIEVTTRQLKRLFIRHCRIAPPWPAVRQDGALFAPWLLRTPIRRFI